MRNMKRKAFGTVTAVFCLTLAFLLSQAGFVHGGIWNSSWQNSDHVWTLPATDNTGDLNMQVSPSANDETATGPLAVTSSATKLFWLECGPNNDCANASLWYYDPGAVSPIKTLFAAGIITDPYNASIPTGTVDLGTYHISNMKIGYVVYAKGGKLWLVDTTTLVKKQMSSETGFAANTVCGIRTVVNWQNPLTTTMFYVLAGSDAACSTDDDIWKAVKGSMGATTSPINVGRKEIVKLLFDGTYVALNFGTSPFKVSICQSNLITCSPIGTFTDSAQIGPYDATRFLMNVDGNLKAYNYVSKSTSALYTLAAEEKKSDWNLDRDGYVYFSTYTTVAPFTYAIKKVPVGGGTVTTLATFTTPTLLPQDSWCYDITPSYIVYQYPNAVGNSSTIYSVPKAGGTPLLLTNAAVNGGGIGDYLIFEDTLGKVTLKNLSDGLGAKTRVNAQLNGFTKGNAGDWYYEFDTTTFRIYLSGLDNKVKSYAWGDDISNTLAGTLIGTLPVNLNNLEINWGLATAGKRNTDFSYGRDVLYLQGTTPSSLKRVTNTNGAKELMNHRN